MKTLGEVLFLLFLGGLGVFIVLFCMGLVLGGIAWIGRILFYVFYPLYFITLKPILWAFMTIRESRCPECKEYFKREFVKSEITGQSEILKTINRIDRGVLYSNRLLVPNQGYEVARQEQVNFVQRTIREYWRCKNSNCAHEWYTEEFSEDEGSL